MIWVPETVQSVSSLSAYIQAYLSEQGLLDGNLDLHRIEAVSHAIAAYLELHSDRTGFFVEDGNLLVLASQALRAMGEEAAATRMLLFGTGFARPAAWLVRAQGGAWTLDVARIASGEAVGLEIMFFRCLHAALDALSEQWDVYDGSISLVLKGLDVAGATILQQEATSRPVAEFCDEVERVCRERLRLLAEKRHWRHIPQIMRATLLKKKRVLRRDQD